MTKTPSAEGGDTSSNAPEADLDDAGRDRRRVWFGLLAVTWTLAFAALLLDPTPHPPQSFDASLVNAIGHFGGAALLTVLLVLGIEEFIGRRSPLAVVIATVLTGTLAGGAELAQLWITSRQLTVSDIVLDLSGMAVGLLIVAVTRRLGRPLLIAVRSALSGTTIAMAVIAIGLVLSSPTSNPSAAAAESTTSTSEAGVSSGDADAAVVAAPTSSTIFTPIGDELPITSRPDLALTEADGPCVADIEHEPELNGAQRAGSGRRAVGPPIAAWNFVPDDAGVVVNAGGDPGLDLLVVDSSDIEWLPGGGVRFGRGGGALRSRGPTESLVDAVMANGTFTISATVRPESSDLGGPARIVTISAGASLTDVALHLGQDHDRLSTRVRYDCSSSVIWIVTDDVFAVAEVIRRVTVSFDGRFLRTYVDGGLESVVRVHDDVDLDWRSDFGLIVGNEASFDRPFVGDVLEVSIHDVALDGDGMRLEEHGESAGDGD